MELSAVSCYQEVGVVYRISSTYPICYPNLACKFNFTCHPPMVVTDLGEVAIALETLELSSYDIRRDAGVEGCGDLLECLEQRDDPKMDNLYAPLSAKNCRTCLRCKVQTLILIPCRFFRFSQGTKLRN